MSPNWGHFPSRESGCDLTLGGLRVRGFCELCFCYLFLCVYIKGFCLFSYITETDVPSRLEVTELELLS